MVTGTLVSSCTLLVFRLYWTQVKKINVVGMPESRTQIILVVPRATQLFQCCFVTNEGHVTKRNRRALVKIEFGFGELF